MNIAELIKTAKIGRERKDAQVETCSAFAAALYDVLSEYGFDPGLVCVGYRGSSVASTWYHAVVSVDGVMYDSMGEFSEEILRARLKIKPSSTYELSFVPEPREGCYDEADYRVLYEFLVDELGKSAKKLAPPATRPISTPQFAPR